MVLKKIIICLLSFVYFTNCSSQKRLKSDYKMFPSVEITYTDSKKNVVKVADKEQMESIISIIGEAKKTPAKFIIIEEIQIKKEGGEYIKISKNKEFISINGVTFILRKMHSEKLNKLLQAKAH